MKRKTAQMAQLLIYISFLLLFTITALNQFLRYPEILGFNSTNEHFQLEDTLGDISPMSGDSTGDPDFSPASLFIDEKDVEVLTEVNFVEFLANNRYVMVNFYATWCYWSKKLIPEYAAAATMLKGEVVFAKVSSVETNLFKLFNIGAYPTIYLFISGTHRKIYDHKLGRCRNDIASWVKNEIMGGVHSLSNVQEARRFFNNESFIILGILDPFEEEELVAASNLLNDTRFYRTTNIDILNLLNADNDNNTKRPALVILDKELELYIRFDGPFTRLAIANFVFDNKPPLVTRFRIENAGLIFDNSMKQVWLFASRNNSKRVTTPFREAAKCFRGKVFFVYVEMEYEGGVGKQLAYKFGVTKNAPMVVAYSTNSEAKYVYNGELTLNNIKVFVEGFLRQKDSNLVESNSIEKYLE